MYISVHCHRSAIAATVAGNPHESVEHLARRAARFWYDHVDHTGDLFTLQHPTTGVALQGDRSLADAGVADGSHWDLAVTARTV